MFLDARERVIGPQQNERKRFIVAQQHVVRRAKTLDQLCFEQQRLGLGICRDDGHGPRLADHPAQAVGQSIDRRIVCHPVLERPCLAHIKHIALGIAHPVDARLRLERLHRIADDRDALVDIGLVRAAHGRRRAILVETLGIAVGRGFGLAGHGSDQQIVAPAPGAMAAGCISPNASPACFPVRRKCRILGANSALCRHDRKRPSSPHEPA